MKKKMLKTFKLILCLVVCMSSVLILHTEVQAKDLMEEALENFTKINIAAGESKSNIEITDNTVITFAGDAQIKGTAGKSAIKIKDGVQVLFILNGGAVNIVSTAGDTKDSAGAAGIDLPKNAKLVMFGTGSINVVGADGFANSVPGSGPSDKDANIGGTVAGKGASGATAPGAGIGGSGGIGGDGGLASIQRADAEIDGQNGKNGTNGGGCGFLYVYGTIQLEASSGKPMSTPNTTPMPGTATGESAGKFVGDVERTAGGHGGTAFASPGIGGAGGGAGGGGSGGNPHNTTGNWEVVPGGGAGGGAGATGGAGSKGGKEVSGGLGVRPASDGNAGGNSSGGVGGQGSKDTAYGSWFAGDGGNGGNAGTSAVGGKIYRSATASVTTKNGGTSVLMGEASRVVNDKVIFIGDLNVEVDDVDSYVYDGTAKNPDITVTYKDGSVIPGGKGDTYSINAYNNINATSENSKAEVRLTPMGNIDTKENYIDLSFFGSYYSVKFDIAKADDPFDISTTTGLDEITYGSSFTANTTNINISNKGTIDWKVDTGSTGNAKIVPSNDTKSAKIVPTKVGILKLKATLSGDSNFNQAETVYKDINILPYNLDTGGGVKFASMDPMLYSGVNIEPIFGVDYAAPEFSRNEDDTKRTLTFGSDFEMSYGDETTNLNANGLGKMKVKGIGNFTGERNFEFPIEPRDINDAEVSVALNNVTYTGSEEKVQPVIKIKNNILPLKDYTAIHKDENNGSDLINAGVKSVEISGVSNLKNSRTDTYEIEKANIQDVMVKKAASDVIFDNKNIESRGDFTFLDKALTEQTTDSAHDPLDPDDYELEFSNHKRAGDALVKVKGVNNFKGETSYTYKVLPRTIYLLPDEEQWKYYGTSDKFGPTQEFTHPTYLQYVKKLNDSKTKEEDEKLGSFIEGYDGSLVGELSRTPGDEINAYPFTQGSLKLDDGEDKNKDYQLKLIDNLNLYTIKALKKDNLNATLVGTMGNNNWYKTRALIVPPQGFKISKSSSLDVSNIWSDNISNVDGDYEEEKTNFYLRRQSDGAITEVMDIEYKQDTQSPIGNLALGDTLWNDVKLDTSFINFFNEDKDGSISGEDALSGVKSTHYFYSKRSCSKQELDDLKFEDKDLENNDGRWLSSSNFKLSIEQLNGQRGYVYGRIEDEAGNVSYISTEGIVFDENAPVLSAEYLQDGKWTKDGNVFISGNVFDDNAGLKERYVAYEVNGDAVHMLDVDQDGNFKIQDLKDGDYMLNITAWDKANNQAKPITFHVMKDAQIPRLVLNGETTKIQSKGIINFETYIGPSGEKKLEVSFNNGEWTEVKEGTKQDYEALENGEYSFRVTNGMGVVSDAVKIKFTKIDRKMPILEVKGYDAKGKENPSGGIVNQSVDIIFKNLENNMGLTTFQYKLSSDADYGIGQENPENSLNIPSVHAEGMYSYDVMVTAANGLSAEGQYTFGIDRSAPTGRVQIETDETRELLNTLSFSLAFKDTQKVSLVDVQDPTMQGVTSGIDQVEYFILEGKTGMSAPAGDEDKAIEYLVDGKWEEGTSCHIRNDKTYYVYFKISDKAGNISYIRSDEVTINRVAPTIDIRYDRMGMWDDDVDVNVLVSDVAPGLKMDSIVYKVVDNTGATVMENQGSDDFHITGLPNGIYTISMEASDLSGNQSKSAFEVKQDNGIPSIQVQELTDTNTGKTVDIKVVASYLGVSGLDRILLSKNGQTFEDITSQITNGKYITNENGVHIFRAVSGAGAYQDASVTIQSFVADSVVAKVVAKNDDFTPYVSGQWTNQNVSIDFSNTTPNLLGLRHFIKEDNELSWREVTAVNGKIHYDVQTDGIKRFEYKVSLQDLSQESTPISFEVKVDKTLPGAKIKVDTVEYDGIIDAILDGSFQNERQVAQIKGTDSGSGVYEDEVYYFYDKKENIPDILLGNIDAKKIETALEGRWIRGNQVTLSPNEVYVVYGKVSDYAGNVSYVSSDGMVFDDVDPSISSDVQDTWYTKDTQTITITLKDNLSKVKEASYRINGVTKQATLDYGRFVIPLQEFPQGKNILEVSVKDNASNEHNEQYEVKKDTFIPTIVATDITGNTGLVSSRLIEVVPTVKDSGLSKVEVREPDASGWRDITDIYQHDYRVKDNGTYWFRVSNQAGISSVPFALTVGNISKDVPVISYVISSKNEESYTEGDWTNQEVEVSFHNAVGDMGISQYAMRIDGGSWEVIEEGIGNAARFTPIEGSHVYEMKITNTLGLESEIVQAKIMVDMSLPSIDVSKNNEWSNQSVELQVHALDTESGLQQEAYSFNNGATWNEKEDVNVYANKEVLVKVRDKAGNEVKQKVSIDHIDTQAPSLLKYQELNEKKDANKKIEVALIDYKNLAKQTGSGVKSVYATNKYPYINGELMARDAMQVLVAKDGVYRNEIAIKTTNEDEQIWIIVEDNAGNIGVYDQSIWFEGGTDNPGKPSDPTNPSKPNNPEIHPGSGSTEVITSVNTITNKTSQTIYMNEDEKSNAKQESTDIKQQSVNKDQEVLHAYNQKAQSSYDAKKIWIGIVLLILSLLYASYLRRRYKKLKEEGGQEHV